MSLACTGRAALATAVVVPLVVALVRGGGPRAVATRVRLSWLAATAALVACGIAVHLRTFGLLAGTRAHPWAGLLGDPLTTVLITLVTTVGALVQSFASRYLYADTRAGRFGSLAGAVVFAMVVVASAATVTELVVGWVLAGAGFVAVVGYRPDLPGVTGCRKATLRALLAGDGCLVAAAGIVLWKAGDVALGSAGSLGEAATRLGAWHPVVALLVAAAALSRCAQGPFRRWLPATVASPTPACALLHAGVVNGGGILLVRLGVLGTTPLAAAAVLVVAGTTSVWAGLVVTARADVKGALAWSTMGQMGFMLAECAVGAYPAAVVHLVGHALYKAYLFFSSGSTVSRPDRVRASLGTRSGARVLASTLAGSAAAAAAAPGLAAGDGWPLVAFAGVSGGVLAWAFTGHRPLGRSHRLAWPALLVLAAALYGALDATLGGLVAPFAGSAGGVLGPPWLLAVGGATVAAALVGRRPGARVRLVDAGGLPASPSRHRHPLAGVDVAAGLATVLAGERRAA